MVEWGTFKFLVNSRSYPKAYLGYVFRDNNPYFMLTLLPAKNVRREDSAGQNNSLRIELYFTRTMAEDVANLFDQEYLLSLLPESVKVQPAAGPRGAPVVPDTYAE
jgi:hypothetical protein